MKLPLLSAREVLSVLNKLGFRIVRQTGSHVQLKNLKGVLVTVPMHPGRDLGTGLLRRILRDLKMTREEFMRYI